MTERSDIASRLAPGSPLDPAAVGRLLDLDPTGASGLLQRLVQASEASVARLMPQLDTALAGGDFETVRSVAHTLKSSMANMGALRFSALCAEVEQRVRSGEVEALDALVARMREDVRAVCESLRSLAAAQG